MSILDFDFESTTRQQAPIAGKVLWLTTIKAGNIEYPVSRYGETDHQSFCLALSEYNKRCEELERLAS